MVPPEFLRADSDCQRAVACHEYIHIRDRHWLQVVLEECVRAIFWFHPAITWLVGEIRKTREQVVDRNVLELLGEKEAYLNALLWIAGLKSRGAALPAPSFAAERHLAERVELLVKETSMSKSRWIASVLVILVLTLGTGAVAVAALPLKVQAPRPDSQNTVLGTVVDPSGAVVPDVKILLVDTVSKEVIARTSSDSQGRFSISRPWSEHHILRFEYPGFKAHVLTSSHIQTENLDVRLQVGQVSESVRVVSSVPSASAIRVIRNQEQSPKNEGRLIMPKLLHKVTPTYPPAARETGVEGRVILDLKIGESGKVEDARILAGHPLLDQAALDAVRMYRFSPAMLRGQPVASALQVTVNFALAERTSEGSASGRHPIRVGGNVLASKLLRKVDPIYPNEAKQARISGPVILQVTIGESGDVEDARVLRGHPALDESALEAVRQWKYQPTLLNGVPVPVIATVTVVYEFR